MGTEEKSLCKRAHRGSLALPDLFYLAKFNANTEHSTTHMLSDLFPTPPVQLGSRDGAALPSWGVLPVHPAPRPAEPQGVPTDVWAGGAPKGRENKHYSHIRVSQGIASVSRRAHYLLTVLSAAAFK